MSPVRHIHREVLSFVSGKQLFGLRGRFVIASEYGHTAPAAPASWPAAIIR
jgi:hypothetical protein